LITVTTPTLIAYKGPTSQTGLAATSEFPSVEFGGKSESFDQIAEGLKKQAIIAVLPMWNSHEGEIVKSRVLELLFDGKARLHQLWPRAITFECVVRRAGTGKNIGRTLSVLVARTQCSRFIEERRASFEDRPSTVDAYDEFVRDTSVDAVLCAPGQNTGGFPTLADNAANPVNFTTFALLGCISSKEWSKAEWGPLYDALTPRTRSYAGVQMPIQVSTSDDQEQLLVDLTDGAESIDDLPNVLFVTRRPEGMCGLIIEGDIGFLGTRVILEERYSTDISVNPDIGESPSQYRERTRDFFKGEFSVLASGEFLRHIGSKTCLFACPPLGMITHGFDAEVVEPVFRRIINKWFELFDNGIRCTEPQRSFFEKHLNDYYDKGGDFVEFVDVGL
jgi:prephenate dehydratase